MFTNENVVENDDVELEAYGSTMEESKLKSAINQLRRFYPDCIIPQNEDSLYILDRTMAYMSHLDRKFDLNQTFDIDHFNKMVNEANIYRDWLNSDEDIAWPPEGLKYSPVVDIPEMDNDTDSKVLEETQESDEKVERTPRGKSKTSRYQQGKNYFLEDIAQKYSREYTLNRMVADLGLSHATANVYYSKYKSECNMI